MGERLKIYESEGFTHKVVKIDIGGKQT
jgi:hypothetical protein